MSDDRNEYEFPYKSYEEIQSRKKKKAGIRGAAAFAALAVLFICASLLVGIWWGGSPLAPAGQSVAEKEGAAGQPQKQYTVQGEYSMPIEGAPQGSEESLIVVNDVSKVVKKAKASVVGITAEIYSNFSSGSSGSGIILTENGYIVTNRHVISEGESITVTLYDGAVYPAYFIGEDAYTDIAVIKIEAQGLSAAVFGDSDAVEVGETAVAIGNPTGQLLGTVTAGIISAVSRDIWLNNNLMTLIQTDASINSGNSGGPLLNKYGQVVGINSAKISASNYEGLGFAIPINTVKPIVEELIERGYISGRPIVGVAVSEISMMASRFYGIPQGLYVSTVLAGSDAEAQGIAAGDVITAINGTKSATLSEASAVRNTLSAGDAVTLTVYRKGRYSDIKLTLGEQNTENTGFNF